ncbi:hypothetical protein LCGC14_0524380 [marine sediment metagenome]|uniref:Uncharacterized protein n=1 Tax=marine sediment metagenome TaxID=412755 RepID=A0A0F9SFV4_9ZZZZ
MIRKKLSNVSLVLYLIIIGLTIGILILNIEVFTVVLKPKWGSNLGIFQIDPYPRHLFTTYIIHISSSEVSFFFIIIVTSFLEIFLNLFIQHRYLKYYLIGISSIIPLSIHFLIFVDPKLLILTNGVYLSYITDDFDLIFHNISTGGIIAIFLSSLLIINSITTIFIGIRYHQPKEIANTEGNKYHSISKSRLICPYCRSAIRLEDYYCLFCSGIVYVYATTH